MKHFPPQSRALPDQNVYFSHVSEQLIAPDHILTAMNMNQFHLILKLLKDPMSHSKVKTDLPVHVLGKAAV